MIQKSIRLSLDVSPELNNALNEMAKKTHTSKSDVLRKSVVLMELAVNEKEKGRHLGIVDQNNQVIKEIVGL